MSWNYPANESLRKAMHTEWLEDDIYLPILRKNRSLHYFSFRLLIYLEIQYIHSSNCRWHSTVKPIYLFIWIPDNKNNGQNAYHHRSLCKFMWQLILISITEITRRINPGKRSSFLVSYKHSMKTITVLELKDILFPKDSELKHKIKGDR